MAKINHILVWWEIKCSMMLELEEANLWTAGCAACVVYHLNHKLGLVAAVFDYAGEALGLDGL